MAFHVERPELIVHVGTGYQVTLGIEVHPIGAATLIGEQYDFSRLAVPTVNLIVGLVCKVDITLCICCGPFRKAIRIGDFYRSFTFCDDIIRLSLSTCTRHAKNSACQHQ